jgi:hypothetical protein
MAIADTDMPTVAWGYSPSHANGVVQIQVQGPKDSWGTRKVLKSIAEQIDKLEVYSGKCADAPDRYCIKVQIRNYGENDWAGQMWRGADDITYIQYNTFYVPFYEPYAERRERKIACHESLHGLGMDHHEQAGCVSNNMMRKNPSSLEMSVLKEYYEGQVS